MREAQSLDRRRPRPLVPATVALALSLALVGCALTDDPQAVQTVAHPGLDLTAEVDPSTGRITLPADRFQPTMEESDLLSTAASTAIADCAAERGVSFQPAVSAFDPVYAVSNRYGVWTREMAQRFAFTTPMTAADLSANGIRVEGAATADADPGPPPNAHLTTEDREILDECAGAAEVKQFDASALLGPGPWGDEIQAATEAAFAREAVQVFDDYAACLVEHGHQADPANVYVAQGADPQVIDEEQTLLALAVVDCKTSVDMVTRLATLEAAAQAPVIDRHAAELIAQQERVQAAVAAARERLAP